MLITSRDRYLPFAPRRARFAPLRLYCFPHAGGGASAYRDWPALLLPHVDVQPVQLPGRETLVTEPAHESVEPLVAELLPVLLADADRPYALFGHSMGAVVATELAAAVQRAGGPMPVLVAVSGRGGQAVHARRDPVPLDDDRLVRALAEFDGTDPRVLAHPELRELTLRTMRRDMALCASYRASFDRLDCPLIAFGGLDDGTVPPGELDVWATRTTGWRGAMRYSGGHFFLREHAADMARVLLTELIRPHRDAREGQP